MDFSYIVNIVLLLC